MFFVWQARKEYKISASEDWVSPEETLVDSGSDYRDIEVPISNSIFRITLFTVLALSFLVIVFVFDLSIIRYAYFSGAAFQNKTINFSIPPPRGIIFDRLGRPLAINKPVFDLLAVSKEIKDNYEYVAKTADILGEDREKFRLSVTENAKNNSVFFVASELDKNQVLAIKTMGSRGFYIIPNTKRYYVDGSQFSQILGYLGKVGKKELDDDNYYYPTDIIGRLGVEAQYEQYLRGEHGNIFFSVGGGSAFDRQFSSDSKDPVIGKSLVLNIDYDLQKRLFNELFNVLKDANYAKAAAIVQDPITGAVLAMASFPAYDNNSFIEGLSKAQFENLFENKSRPLFNRVVSGLYNPGSTIKPLIGLMTLEEDIFSPSDTIQNCTELTVVNPYNSDDTYTFNNWRLEYGPFNFKRAIANSCNIYFFIAGGGYGSIKGLGVERIARYLKLSLADSKLGIDLPGEEQGFVPTPNWKLAARGENWYQGDTYNISVGQGDLLVTPLWLNSYISAIANNGIFYKPLMAKQILDNENVVQRFEPEIIGRLNFKEEVIQEVKNAMLETTISGTAKILGTLPVKIGAKTGTAEVIKGRKVNSIITAFGPFNNPEVTITVLIEGGTSTNEGLAVRSAYGFLKWYFNPALNKHITSSQPTSDYGQSSQ